MGADFNDWAQDKSNDEIRSSLDGLGPHKPRVERQRINGITSKRINLVPFDDVTLDTTGTYIVKGLIPDQGLTVVWGPPKCGKSFLASDIAFHVALGWEWRGKKVKTGPVVYLAAEGSHGFRARKEAFKQERLRDEAGAIPFYLVPVTINLIGEHIELIGAVRETLGDTNPVLIVVDTLNRTLRGSENSDEDMSNYIKAADAIREAFSCAVVIVHHCGVEGSRPRGHTSLSGAVDAQISVKKNTGGTITATIELCKDGPEGEAFGSTLRVIEVGTDDDDDPITSCVIEPAEPAERQGGMKLSATMRRGLEVLHELLIAAGQPSPGGQHYPHGVLVVSVDMWKEYLFKAGVLDPEAKNPREPFRRLKNGLIERGAIREWDGLIWTISAERETRDGGTTA